MNKREFLKELEKRLKNLPDKEIKKSLAFYAEIIDDRMEEGASEAEAVRDLGSPDEVARTILSDASFVSLVRGGAARIKTRGGGSPVFVVLAVLGFPLWFPLLAAAAALLFSGAIVLFALWLSAVAVLGALLLSSAAGVVGAAFSFFTGETASAVFLAGASIALFAATLLVFPAVKKALKALWRTAGKWLKGIKRLFINRREEKI